MAERFAWAAYMRQYRDQEEARASRWRHAICERCWIAQNAQGTEQELVVRVPVRVTGDALHLETCGWCGLATIFGVYVRADPATVPFP